MTDHNNPSYQHLAMNAFTRQHQMSSGHIPQNYMQPSNRPNITPTWQQSTPIQYNQQQIAQQTRHFAQNFGPSQMQQQPQIMFKAVSAGIPVSVPTLAVQPSNNQAYLRQLHYPGQFPHANSSQFVSHHTTLQPSAPHFTMQQSQQQPTAMQHQLAYQTSQGLSVSSIHPQHGNNNIVQFQMPMQPIHHSSIANYSNLQNQYQSAMNQSHHPGHQQQQISVPHQQSQGNNVSHMLQNNINSPVQQLPSSQPQPPPPYVGNSQTSPQQQPEKRQRKPLTIVDPQTNKEVDLQHDASLEQNIDVHPTESFSASKSNEDLEVENVPDSSDDPEINANLIDNSCKQLTSSKFLSCESSKGQFFKLVHQQPEQIQNQDEDVQENTSDSHFEEIDNNVLDEPEQEIPAVETSLKVPLVDNESTEQSHSANEFPETSLVNETNSPSPTPSGDKYKYKYSKEQLMDIRDSHVRFDCPRLNPDVHDLILCRTDFTPSYVSRTEGLYRNNRQQNTRQTQHKTALTNRQRMNGAARQPVRVIEARREKEELARSESAYVPSFINKSKPNGDNSHLVNLRRRVLIILNKIAPQNFDQCMKELIDLNINATKEGMEMCIDTLFEKAVKEEAYSVTFADVCRRLSTLKHEIDVEQCITFKSLLLNRCQKMFETPLKEQLENVSREWEEKMEAQTNEKIKKVMENDKEEQIKKAKDKYHGNIRFIGELFMKDLLSGSVILHCIAQLLKNQEEQSLESLCKLLETVGSKLDTQKSQDTMNGFFRRISELIENTKDSRIKYKLMDIKDMRSRNWSLRKIQAEKIIKPMTKEELEKRQQEQVLSIEAEKQRIEAEKSRFRPKQTDQRNQGGFTVVTRKGSSQRSYSKQPEIQIAKMTLSTNLPDSNFKFGPSTNWSLGSRVTTDDKASTLSRTSSGRSNASLQNSREASRSRDASPKTLHNSSSSSSLNKLPHSQSCNIAPPGLSSNPQSFSASSVALSQASVSSSHTQPSHKSIESISLHLLDEFYNAHNIDESALRRIESCGEEFVETLINAALDFKKERREAVGSLLYRLIKDCSLTPLQVVSGFDNICNEIDDLAMDVGKSLWLYLAECFHMLLQPESINLDFVIQLIGSIPDPRNSATVLAYILRLAEERLDKEALIESFHCANISWSSYGLSDPVSLSKFLAEHNIEHFGGSSNSDIIIELKKLKDRSTFDPGELERLLDTLPITESSISREIIRHCTECVVKNYSLNLNKNDSEVLMRLRGCIDHQEENEILVLSTIHECCPDDDFDRLRSIITKFVSTGVISYEAIQSYLTNNQRMDKTNFITTLKSVSERT